LVGDLVAFVASRGYDGIAADEHGIWTAPGGSRIAWFTDSHDGAYPDDRDTDHRELDDAVLATAPRSTRTRPERSRRSTH
jgi:hypothetical protein